MRPNMGGANRAAVQASVQRHFYQNRPSTVLVMPPRAAIAAAVGAVTDTLDTEAVTLAELSQFIRLATQFLERAAESQELAAEPQELAAAVEQTTPKFVVLNSYLRENPYWIPLLGIVVTILLAIYNHPDHTPAPPPQITVVVTPPDRAEIDRIIDDKLEELRNESATPDDGPETKH